MAVLFDGKWTDDELPQETSATGQFKRVDSSFRDRITADARRSYQEIANRYGDLLEGSIETSQDLLVHHSTLMWELQQEQAIRQSFWRSLLGSGIVIAWSIVGLALVPELSVNTVLADVFLGSSVLGALTCLFLFGALLRVMVRSATIEDVGNVHKR